MQEQKLKASELQEVYEQLTQREVKLRASQARSAAEREAAAADVATRQRMAAAKLQAAEELESRLNLEYTQLKDTR